MIICPKCQFETEGFKFCPECGCKLPAAEIFPAAVDSDAFDWDNLSDGGSLRIAELSAQVEEDALAAFEWEKHQNGKYVILSLKDKSEISITVPANVEAIGPGAFEGSDIMQITIPEGLLKIGDRAFADCAELDSIVFPESLRVIGEEAFAGCVHLNTAPPQ